MKTKYFLNELKFDEMNKSIFNSFMVFKFFIERTIISYIYVMIKCIFRSGITSKSIGGK